MERAHGGNPSCGLVQRNSRKRVGTVMENTELTNRTLHHVTRARLVILS